MDVYQMAQKNKIHEKMWEVKDAPLLWAETIHEGDIYKIKKVFGISYGGHYFIGKNQTTFFFRNKKSSEIAKKQGSKKFRDAKFVDKFCNETRIVEKKINKLIDDISESNLKQKNDDELLQLYLEFFDLYSSLVGLFRCTRPDFYEKLTEYLKERIPEPKEDILSKLLNNKIDEIDAKIDNEIKILSMNLYKIGKRRFEMHTTWLNTFIKAEKLFNEIGKRVGLTSLEVKNCLSTEIKSFLLKEKKPDKGEIRKRINFFKLEYTDDRFKVTTEEDKKIEEIVLKEIKGQCANLGKVKGKVFILKESLGGVLIEEMKKMDKGDILVATNTSPDMILAIEKASAIVTDEGGMLCHAAIVSREFNIPCIVGTGNATAALKEGDIIEIDALKGVVKKIK